MLAYRIHLEQPALALRREVPSRGSIGARRNPESTRAILDAAEAILARDGLAGFSMDAVARLAQCGKPTLYRWWPERAALFAEIHERLMPPMRSAETDLDQLAARWQTLWHSTLAGICLRGMLAEAQGSAVAASMLSERGLEPYRRDVSNVLGASVEVDRVEEILHQTLFPLIGKLMLDSGVATLRRVDRIESRAKAQATAAESVREGESVRHRGEWVD